MWTAIWVVVAVGLVVIFALALREFLMWIREGVLWYWRIPERVALMEEIRDELRIMNARTVPGEEPAVFKWRDHR